MTTRTSARIAGMAFLIYIVAGLSGMALTERASRGADMPARIAAVASQMTEMRVALLLNLVAASCAFLLAMSLYSLTRSADRELAVLGMLCRAGEGVLGMLPTNTLGMLWLARGGKAPSGDAASAIAATLLASGQWQSATAALLFAGGSTAFAFAFLRGGLLPPALARLGVAASLLLIATLPLEMAGWIRGTAAYLAMWMPMLVFELWLAGYLILRWKDAPR